MLRVVESRRGLLALPRPAIVTAGIGAVLAMAWVRDDAFAGPATFALATLALGIVALAGHRGLGIDVPLGPLRAGSAAGVMGAALLLVPVILLPAAWQWRAALFLPIAAASVAEELAVRGLVYGLLLPAGAPLAIGGSACVFALMHLVAYGPAAVPLLLGAGVVLGYLRWVTGGLLAPGLAHALINVMAAAT